MTYLCFLGALLDVAALDDTVKLKTAVLVDGREGVRPQATSKPVEVARGIGGEIDSDGRDGGGRALLSFCGLRARRPWDRLGLDCEHFDPGVGRALEEARALLKKGAAGNVYARPCD